jgi:hypothetical protein
MIDPIYRPGGTKNMRAPQMQSGRGGHIDIFAETSVSAADAIPGSEKPKDVGIDPAIFHEQNERPQGRIPSQLTDKRSKQF